MHAINADTRTDKQAVIQNKAILGPAIHTRHTLNCFFYTAKKSVYVCIRYRLFIGVNVKSLGISYFSTGMYTC